jgi:hypothetical protein
VCVAVPAHRARSEFEARLDVVAVAGLILFARKFGEDTPDTRRRARRVMFGVYGLILLLGLAFAFFAFTATPIQVRTAVQAVIFFVLGGGGLAVNARGGRSAG